MPSKYKWLSKIPDRKDHGNMFQCSKGLEIADNNNNTGGTTPNNSLKTTIVGVIEKKSSKRPDI